MSDVGDDISDTIRGTYVCMIEWIEPVHPLFGFLRVEEHESSMKEHLHWPVKTNLPKAAWRRVAVTPPRTARGQPEGQALRLSTVAAALYSSFTSSSILLVLLTS